MSKRSRTAKSQVAQSDTAETSSKTLSDSDSAIAANTRESAEKPVSLAPLGFEDALRGLLATGRKQ